jgi:hypothetical protein
LEVSALPVETPLVPNLERPAVRSADRFAGGREACSRIAGNVAAGLELHVHIVPNHERRLVMSQEIAPVILLLERNERIVDDVSELRVQSLAGRVTDALMLCILSPLRPVTSSSICQHVCSKETSATETSE